MSDLDEFEELQKVFRGDAIVEDGRACNGRGERTRKAWKRAGVKARIASMRSVLNREELHTPTIRRFSWEDTP